MPRVLNFGSLNIDYVYAVPHFVRGGETLAAASRAVHIGGKGLNQSVSLARAGLAPMHAGIIGGDGSFLKGFLAAEGVDVSRVAEMPEEPSGHTFIQVRPEGENAILYYPGTNERLTEEFVKSTLDGLESGDVLLLQNETNLVDVIIREGLARGLRVIFNPAPFDEAARRLPLNALHAVVLNQTEAQGLVSEDPDELDREDAGSALLSGEALFEAVAAKLPHVTLIITQGSKGAAWRRPSGRAGFTPAFPVAAVDTTGAGDAFTGYAVRALVEALAAEDDARAAGRSQKDAVQAGDDAFALGMRLAAMAAAISVTRHGAAESIPTLAAAQAALADADAARSA